MPRPLVMPVAASPRQAFPPDYCAQAAHQDRGTSIMSGMDGSNGKPVSVLGLKTGSSRVCATLEGASA